MNISEILNKLANRTATPEELSEFHAYLQKLDEKEFGQLLDIYGNIVSQIKNPGTPDEILFEQIRSKIETFDYLPGSDSAKTGLLTKFKKGSEWYLVAAAVLVIILSGIHLISRSGKKTSPVVVSKNIRVSPGTNKAVLTLANGKQIVLDETSKGNIGSDAGAKIIKLDSGLVAYKDNSNQNNEIAYNTISTPRGGQYQLILPDGTHAWLNAASSLRFPTQFRGSERRVELTGEGYFDVTHDPAHPFIVSFSNTEVKVLGTEFNIMAYDDEAATQTTLVRGSVRLSKGHQQALLQPGKMAVVKDEHLKVQEADIEQVTAWKNGMLSLENADLATVLRQVSRWYNVNIHYQGSIPEKRFFGLISRNVNLSTIIEFLQKNNVHIKQEGNVVTVVP
jgi:ferric-dicitrate binding protein FerR (iron transport regulator)